MLVIVAPVTMTTEQREIWLRGAVDALEGIHAHEVAAISAELRRSVTRHNQIVPEISKLVAAKRARSTPKSTSPYAAEREIYRRADEMRAAAMKDKRKLSDAFEWERQARIDAGLHVEPYPKPLTAAELENMPAHIKRMGLNSGFLEYRGGQVVESTPSTAGGQ